MPRLRDHLVEHRKIDRGGAGDHLAGLDLRGLKIPAVAPVDAASMIRARFGAPGGVGLDLSRGRHARADERCLAVAVRGPPLPVQTTRCRAPNSATKRPTVCRFEHGPDLVAQARWVFRQTSLGATLRRGDGGQSAEARLQKSAVKTAEHRSRSECLERVGRAAHGAAGGLLPVRDGRVIGTGVWSL
jgi:hypothetical protein